MPAPPTTLARPLLLALAVLCGGCVYTSTSYGTVRVTVLDADTGEPVTEARVVARTVNLYQTAYPYDIHFLMKAPDSGSAVVDANGDARLQVVEAFPVQLIVIAPGYEPWQFTIEDVTDGAALRAERDITAGLPPSELARLRIAVAHD